MSKLNLINLTGITIELSPAMPGVSTEKYFLAEVKIQSGVFSGEFQTAFFAEDFYRFKKDLLDINAEGGTATLGGGRSAEITFQFAKQIGGAKDSLSATIGACTCGDDPWPMLTFLEFNVPQSFAALTVKKIDEVLKQ